MNFPQFQSPQLLRSHHCPQTQCTWINSLAPVAASPWAPLPVFNWQRTRSLNLDDRLVKDVENGKGPLILWNLLHFSIYGLLTKSHHHRRGHALLLDPALTPWSVEPRMIRRPLQRLHMRISMTPGSWKNTRYRHRYQYQIQIFFDIEFQKCRDIEIQRYIYIYMDIYIYRDTYTVFR